VIYFNDHLHSNSTDDSTNPEPLSLKDGSDNLINFPASYNPQEEEVSKWVNILMNQSGEFSLSHPGDINDDPHRDPLDLLAETLLDKGVL
jgi:hypothetical protein